MRHHRGLNMMMMLRCNIDRDLESAEAVVVRASRRMRGASSILETGPGVEVRRLLCGPYVTPLIRRWEHVSGVTKVNAALLL